MPDLTCAEVDDRDLEAGYLAGRLTDEEAQAYEAHYFGCDRCWRALETALAVRAASAPARRPRVSVRTLAAAATVALAAGAGWWIVARDPTTADADAFRGSRPVIAVRMGQTPAGLALTWPPRAGTDRYRVRVFGADGALLLERATGDTVIALAPPAGSAFLEVAALDSLLAVLGASGLVPLTGPR